MFMPILSSYLLTVEWNNFTKEISVLLIVPTKLSWLKLYTFGDRFMLKVILGILELYLWLPVVHYFIINIKPHIIHLYYIAFKNTLLKIRMAYRYVSDY